MKKEVFFVVVTMIIFTCAIWAQTPLTAEEIQEAIEIGKSCSDWSDIDEKLNMVWHYGDVVLRGPFQRLAVTAFLGYRDAKKNYMEYELSEGDLKKATEPSVSVIYVLDKPRLTDSGWIVPGHAKDMVIVRLENGEEVGDPIRPISKNVKQHSWSNALGQEFSGADISARFDMNTFPFDSDIRIVVIRSDGDNLKYDIRKKYLAIIK